MILKRSAFGLSDWSLAVPGPLHPVLVEALLHKVLKVGGVPFRQHWRLTSNYCLKQRKDVLVVFDPVVGMKEKGSCSWEKQVRKQVRKQVLQ